MDAVYTRLGVEAPLQAYIKAERQKALQRKQSLQEQLNVLETISKSVEQVARRRGQLVSTGKPVKHHVGGALASPRRTPELWHVWMNCLLH